MITGPSCGFSGQELGRPALKFGVFFLAELSDFEGSHCGVRTCEKHVWGACAQLEREMLR